MLCGHIQYIWFYCGLVILKSFSTFHLPARLLDGNYRQSKTMGLYLDEWSSQCQTLEHDSCNDIVTLVRIPTL